MFYYDIVFHCITCSRGNALPMGLLKTKNRTRVIVGCKTCKASDYFSLPVSIGSSMVANKPPLNVRITRTY